MKSTYSEREESVEDYLDRRVRELGGETRKVCWVGRNSAPDRLVGLPPMYGDLTGRHLFFEVKKKGLAAKFPRKKNAHEQAQHREHERLRGWGFEVYVVDDKETIEDLLMVGR